MARRRAELAARWRTWRVCRAAAVARRGERTARRAHQLEPRRQGEPGPVLAWSAGIALLVMAVLVAGATVVSLAESYRGLYDWAAAHGYGHGLWAAVFPIMVDVFVVTGELAAFVSLVLIWPTRTRVAAWLLTLFGLAASVTGNVAHLAPGAPATWRAGAAVPPLAAAMALFVGLGVLKRICDRGGFTVRRQPAPEPVPVPVPRPARQRPARQPVPPPGGDRMDDALAYLAGLARAGDPFPSMRALARSHFASATSPEGNKRAAARALAAARAAVDLDPGRPLLADPVTTVQPILNNHHREMEPAR